MNDIRSIMESILFENDNISVDEFISLNLPTIKEFVHDFDVSKNVIYDSKNKVHKIIVPRNLREKFSELLKNYLESKGVTKYVKQKSSDGQTTIGYFTKGLRALFKPSANKGDVAEGLIGAAITARFINPTTVIITEKHIDDVLDAMRGLYDGKIKSVENTWTIENAKPDEVLFKLAMPKTSLNALLINRNQIKPLYNSVLAYINSKDKVRLIKDICHSENGIYNNQEIDHVTISSMGTENQRGTKIDVSVKIQRGDGKTVELKNLGNISLKALGTKQLYQYGGDKAQNISDFFGTVFGISLPDDIQNTYNTEKASVGKMDSIKKVFQYVYDRIVGKLSGEVDAEEFVQHLANGIRNGALKAKGGTDDEKIILVHLGKDDFHELDFNLIHEKLKGHTLSASLTTDGNNPKIKIFAKKGNEPAKPLISIRARRDGKGMRILLEREKYLDDLITLSKELDDATPPANVDMQPNDQDEMKNIIRNSLYN
jgi:hypothetical protein